MAKTQGENIMTQSSIIPGSLKALADKQNISLAESFINADAIVIVDTSGSMADQDLADGKTRYERACDELAALQNNLPGKIAVLSFSNSTVFCPSGVPFRFGGGTDLAGALRFAKVADVDGMRFIVISDGQPDDETATLNVARTYKNRIDVVYVGSEISPTGRIFLDKLASISGGRIITKDKAVELSSGIKYLLEG